MKLRQPSEIFTVPQAQQQENTQGRHFVSNCVHGHRCYGAATLKPQSLCSVDSDEIRFQCLFPPMHSFVNTITVQCSTLFLRSRNSADFAIAALFTCAHCEDALRAWVSPMGVWLICLLLLRCNLPRHLCPCCTVKKLPSAGHDHPMPKAFASKGEHSAATSGSGWRCPHVHVHVTMSTRHRSHSTVVKHSA